jgi:hypothetical protein
MLTNEEHLCRAILALKTGPKKQNLSNKIHSTRVDFLFLLKYVKHKIIKTKLICTKTLKKRPKFCIKNNFEYN